MLLQSCNGLMRALGADVGIPDLALDEAHCCTLAFDSVVVNFELDESSGQLFFYASLGPMPTASSRVYEQLLEGDLSVEGHGRSDAQRRPEGSRVVLSGLSTRACPKSTLRRRSSSSSTWRRPGTASERGRGAAAGRGGSAAAAGEAQPGTVGLRSGGVPCRFRCSSFATRCSGGPTPSASRSIAPAPACIARACRAAAGRSSGCATRWECARPRTSR